MSTTLTICMTPFVALPHGFGMTRRRFDSHSAHIARVEYAKTETITCETSEQ
jgi:hypothetical protein